MDFKKIYEKTKQEMTSQMEHDKQKIAEYEAKVLRSEGALLALEYMKQQMDAAENKSEKAEKRTRSKK